MSLCSISGVTPTEPVVSTKSGHVFEKRLIIKHLRATNTCPVTREELSEADLIPLQTNPVVQPRPTNASSIPGVLTMLQSEWDSLMLETYTLKQHLASVRQELAHALYQHDAACRVIARLVQERDDARSALGQTQANVASVIQKTVTPTKEDAGEGIESQAVIKTLTDTAMALSKARKKKVRGAQAVVVSKDKLKKFALQGSHPLHSAAQPGILALALHPTDPNLAFTGGADGNSILFDFKAGKILDTLKAHKKKVTSVAFHPTSSVLFTTSADNTSIIWDLQNGKYAPAQTLRNHQAPVVDCSLHPSGQFLATASADKTWCLYDLPSGRCREQVGGDNISGEYTCVEFHPDGLLLGTGTTDSMVRIFSLKEKKNAATFKGHSGKVTALSFSENGYYLATGDEEGTVKLWDLRKLKNFHTIQSKEVAVIGGLAFDESGSYLALAGDDVRVHATNEEWSVVKSWKDHSALVTAVKWGPGANSLVTISKDRTLKIYS